ncbi:prepilin peptidase [Candidatus Uhrbacteria bacterium]|nr:prepilin peptidase [Candidatus Uhrbacteria bacterium]
MVWSTLLVFVAGACVGSFLNVVIFRTNEGGSVARGRSRCRACKGLIGVGDLVPVVSYLLLRGRCRSCKSVISWQYPAVEIATAVLFVVAYRLGGGELVVLRNWVFVSYLVLIFVYDLRYMLIIDQFTIPAMIFAIILNLWLGVMPAWSVLAGGAVLSGFFWIQFALSKGTWVGGGDIRMGALMGFMLGLQHGLVALFIAYVLGAVVGLAMMASGKATRKTAVPFGSFLAVGTVVVLFVGRPLIDWYLGLFL